MLNSLKLTNFKQHRDLTIDFTQGIQCIKGPNEKGKTNALRGVSYALVGSAALDRPIDECVTYGEDVKTLKAVLTLNSSGKVYTFSRSKGGAEVMLDGKVFVTGQKEVSAFAATLLGGDANIASKLAFASQNGIRGALEDGPKGMSTLIEDLAGFSTFDDILEAAQTKLSLGSPALLEERLKGAEATLDAALQNLPALPDTDQHNAVVGVLSDKITSHKETLPALELAAVETEKAWRAASVLYMDRVTLESNVSTAQANLVRAEDQVSALAPAAATLVTDSRPALRQELAEAEDFTKRNAAYQAFSSLPEGPRWSFDAANFEESYGLHAAAKTNREREVDTVLRKITAAEGRRITAGNCSKCGQPTDHLKHVVETNAAVDAEVATLNDLKVALEGRKEIEDWDSDVFSGIRRYGLLIQPLLNKLHGFVTLDESTYPATPTWIGSIPAEEGPDTNAIKARLAKMEAEIKAVESAQAKYELAVEQRERAAHAHIKAQQALATHQSPAADTILELTEAKDNASLSLNAAKGEIIIAEREMAEVQTAYDAATRLWSMAQSRVDDSKKTIDECKKDLGSLAFNNALLKKLRAIRPVIANRLWGTVLSAVSVMFSQVRGTESWITKDVSGFKVNGNAVESLSGSALDVLGLSIRCALLRTFLPQCDLLVLDEPMHGCDEARSEAMLGFLKTISFGQTLLVSHETVSESVADNLIQI